MLPKLLGLWFDPLIVGGQRVGNKYGWVDPAKGMVTAVDQLNSVLPAALRYELTLKEIPIPALGRRTYNSQHIDEIDSSVPISISGAEWVGMYDSIGLQPNQWPTGGEIHIKDFLVKNNLINLVNSGSYDEVWLGGLPIPRAFEGAMIAPLGDTGAYHTHDTLVYVPGLNKRFVWHMFQVQNWNPLHNYWHRIEAIMSRIWGHSTLGYQEQWDTPIDMESVHTYWQLFTMTENMRRGEAQVGSCHFMPNSKMGYEYRMPDSVPSGAHLWKDYPLGFPLDLSRSDRYKVVSASTWANLPDYLWQFSHIPKGHITYSFDGRDANWWKYIVDVNYQVGRGLPVSKPWTGVAPVLPPIAKQYDNRTVVRWEASVLDKENELYTILVDDLPVATIQRRGINHQRLSIDTAVGSKYTIKASTWQQDVQHNTTDVEDGEVVVLEDVQRKIAELHTADGQLTGCPAPDSVFQLDANNYGFRWNLANHTIAVSSRLPLRTIVSMYVTSYEAERTKLCVSVTTPVPTPVPVPVPTPLPNSDLRTIIQTHVESLEAQLKIWRSKL